MKKKQKNENAGLKDEIVELTQFLDVSFILLVFLLLNWTASLGDIKVKLPEAWKSFMNKPQKRRKKPSTRIDIKLTYDKYETLSIEARTKQKRKESIVGLSKKRQPAPAKLSLLICKKLFIYAKKRIKQPGSRVNVHILPDRSLPTEKLLASLMGARCFKKTANSDRSLKSLKPQINVSIKAIAKELKINQIRDPSK